MAHEDLGDTTRHARTCDWWYGAPDPVTQPEAYAQEFTNEARGGCTCALKWRSMVRTEREMHAAWRKRAEEAERGVTVLASEAIRRGQEAIAYYAQQQHWDEDYARVHAEVVFLPTNSETPN